MQPLGQAAPRRPAIDRPAQCARQHGTHLVDAGLEEFGDAYRLASARADLGAHRGEALGPGLEVGDANHVLVGHPQREIARHRRGQRAIAAVERCDAPHPLVIEKRIVEILIIDQPPHAFLDQRRGDGRELLADIADQTGDRGFGQRGRAIIRRQAILRHAAFAHRPAGGEGGEVGLDRDAGLADRRLELRARDRQRGRRRRDAEQHGVERQIARRGAARQIEQQRAAGEGARGCEDAAHVEPAIGHRLLLGDRIDAMGRGGEDGAVGRDEAVLERTAGLEHFGRQHQIDAARARIKRHQRLAPAQRGISDGEDLDIISGGAGALRHAGDRGRLDRQIGAHRRIDDPVGEHAAALAAERGDQDRDRLLAHGPAAAGALRCCSQEITAPRTRSSTRSHAFGFCTISAR